MRIEFCFSLSYRLLVNRFSPTPNYAPADFYLGELARAVIDEDFYANEGLELASRNLMRPYASNEAVSRLNLAGAIAMRASMNLPAAELVHIAQPLIKSCQEYTREAIEQYTQPSFSNKLPQLRAWLNFIPQLILYKPLCFYPEEDESAAACRRQLVADKFDRSIHDLDVVYETYLAHKKEKSLEGKHVEALSGSVLEMTVIALANYFDEADGITLPALSADDFRRHTDAQLIAYDPYISTLRRIRAKTMPMSGRAFAFHAVVTGLLTGDCERRKSNNKRMDYTWDTTKALLATQQGKYQKTGNELVEAKHRIEERSKAVLDYIATRPYFLLGR